MIKCPNCKAEIEENSKFCEHCGKQIHNNNTTIKKDEIAEEEYQKYYIGKNYNNFKNKFNIFAFIFGGLYLFYRKQYLFGTIFIIISVSTVFINPFIAIILHLLLGIVYNQQYIKYVNKKTREIKINNINKPKEYILKICKIKGQPSIVSSVGSVVLILVLIVLILNIGGTNLKGSKGKTIVKVSNNKISNLLFEIPEDFKSSNYNTDYRRAYTYDEDKKYCRIIIETKEDNNYQSINEFISNNIFITDTDVVTNPEDIKINEQSWKRINVENKIKRVTYYSIKYNDLYYVVSYETYFNKPNCNEKYNSFMNSLTFN